ncbi:phosphoribosyltransferase [Jannaschia faecimaris]|nr:phosphoribosyltransferase family protein [Jannaschia faecimaris]
MFQDRADAGRRLAAALPPLDAANAVVVALPRGGIPVAAEICATHGVPLDLVLVRKIGAPGQPELAIGAVTDGSVPQVIVNEAIARQFGLSADKVRGMGQTLLPEIERRRQSYLSGRDPLALQGKTVVVVDDGVATGATLQASLTALKARKPGRVIVAIPVGPHDIADRLHSLADQVICLSDLTYFGAVGGAYVSFPQVDDATVRAAFDRFAPPRAG